MNSKLKTIHILGTAPSIKNYKSDGSETIGVNDVFKYHKVDNLLLMDKSKSFTKERLQTIVESEPKQFYSTLPEWRRFFPEMEKINIGTVPGDVSKLDSKEFIYHVDSTFTAVHLAYKLKATNIIIYGVDFTGDRWNIYKNILLSTYADLYIALQNRNVNLYINSYNSLLSQILPIK